MADINIILCIPVDDKVREQQARQPFPFDLKAHPGYTKAKCERCDLEVWIGPKSKLVKKNDPNRYQVMCGICALRTKIEETGELPDPDDVQVLPEAN